MKLIKVSSESNGKMRTKSLENVKPAIKNDKFSPPDDGVPDIGTLEKPKRGRPKKNPDTLPFYQIQYDLIDWMTGKRTAEFLKSATPFSAKFLTYFQDKRKKSLEVIEVKDGLATITTDQAVYDELVDAMKSFRGPAMQYCLPYRQIDELARAYVKERGPHRLADAPEIFCWESEKGKIAFNRVVDPAPDWQHFYGTDLLRQKAPIYCDFVDRCDQKLAIRQFLGSLLYPKSSHKQSLHLVGERNAGKTTMMEVLLECFFGERGIATMMAKEAVNDSFIKDDYVGKMAIFADELNDFFYSTNDYKVMTGASKQRINVKHKAAYNSEITAKFIATSNDVPSLPPDSAVTDRLILVKVQNLKVFERDRERFKARFLPEVPYIIADILEAFSQLKGNRIQVSLDSHEQSLEIGGATFQVFFDRNFKESQKSKSLSVAEFKEIVVNNDYKITYKQMRQFVAHRYGSAFDCDGWDGVRKFRAVSNIVAIPRSIAGLNL